MTIGYDVAEPFDGCEPQLDAASGLRSAVGSFVTSCADLDTGDPQATLTVGVLFHSLGAEISRAERSGLPRNSIRDIVSPVRDLFALSPFARRTQVWPRGYPGDFQTVEQLVSQTNRAPETTLGWLIESQCLNSPIAQQHRNKVLHQAQLITETILRPGPPARVLMLASGAAPDLRLVPAQIIPADCRFVLNDADPDALEFARTELGSVATACTFVARNALRSIEELASWGPYDLVLAGGLFDYLPDRAARYLAEKVLSRLCRSGGVFYFSNIAAGNPYRFWTEYLVDWTLIERDEAAVRTLLDSSHILIDAVDMALDRTGLTLLAHVRRSSSDDTTEQRRAPFTHAGTNDRRNRQPHRARRADPASAPTSAAASAGSGRRRSQTGRQSREVHGTDVPPQRPPNASRQEHPERRR